MFKSLDSVGIFKPFWLLWRLLGATSWQTRRHLRIIYDILLNIFISLWYPIHLAVGLFQLPQQSEMCKNLSMTITCIVCTLKFYCIRWNLSKIKEMMNLFSQLDERAKSQEEITYFTRISMKNAVLLSRLYFIVYMTANAAAVVATLFDNERRLMYPAWFPFDWHSTSSLHFVAFLYQFVGVTILIIQNYTNDAIASVSLCLLCGHVRLLSMRVAKLGHDTKITHQQNERALILCIEDHIILLRFSKVMEDSLSYVQLILFISSGLNICVVLVYLVFFADGIFTFIYYSTFLFAIGVELFPIYYYGTELQQEFHNLPYAIFSSNWHFQSKYFRQNVVIFLEVTKRQLIILAGGIFEIHLSNFFAICKMSYSLFTVAMRFKKER